MFCDFQITRATYPPPNAFIDKEEFLWRAYKNLALSIFVTEHFCSPFFAVQTTKRIIGVEAWRLVSMVKKGRGKKKKEKKRLERENKFAKVCFQPNGNVKSDFAVSDS